VIIFLAPIYWIASTAFKPRNLATTVPPTVFFHPEV
jgi:multiple sugar transport system permease protein